MFDSKSNDVVLGQRRSHRIPLSLQAVFLSSNRGKEVTKAPPLQVASRSFRNAWSSLKHASHVHHDDPASTGPVSVTTCKIISPLPVSEKHPQEFLEELLTERGITFQRYRTLETAYRNKPTDLQLASYERYLVVLILTNNINELHKLIACGISPNACNQFGESIVHMVCRKNKLDMLNILLQAGANMQVSDDYGRTPLHDAFWAKEPAIEIVQTILARDPTMLFLADARGTLPMGYMKREHYSVWNEFWKNNVDKFFPSPVNELVHAKPFTRCIPDRENAIPLELAKLVAANRMRPHEVALLTRKPVITMTDASADGMDVDESSDYEDDNESDDESHETDDDESFDASEDSDDDGDDIDEDDADFDLQNDLAVMLHAFSNKR
jgi:ankyrin repeat protein